jgi:hypothetical protein
LHDLDTEAQCCVKSTDFPANTTPVLIDVCSYPSSSPSSSPSECVKAVLCNQDSDCSELTDACNTGTCVSDGLTNMCHATPKSDGTSCDDGDACTEPIPARAVPAPADSCRLQRARSMSRRGRLRSRHRHVQQPAEGGRLVLRRR